MQLVKKRMRSKKEQYTQGRLRKYVQTKKRKIKVGEALVGMKRSGNQLERVLLAKKKRANEGGQILLQNRRACLTSVNRT